MREGTKNKGRRTLYTLYKRATEVEMTAKIYTSKTCAPCNTLKQYLKMKSIDYEEVPTDLVGRDEVIALTGSPIVPLMVTDKGIMQGLSFKRLNELLS